MREALAERLLAQVMHWTPEDVASERPMLQAMATFKYDEYQQFSPGMRFVESLALWLSQFGSQEERKIAYRFVKERLVFFSNAEMSHFVSVAYPDHIRPLLIQRTATKLNTSEHKVMKIIQSTDFRLLRRQCLFLGLSDGSRIDSFRRSNPDLSHEQILQTYELSPRKAESLQKKLAKDLRCILGRTPAEYETLFRMVFLLDDFSASGLSYLRRSGGPEEAFDGKIANFYSQIMPKNNGVSSLVNLDDLYIGVVIYIAAEGSRIYLEQTLGELFRNTQTKWSIQIVQTLSNEVTLHVSSDQAFLALVNMDSYYDPRAEDEHTRKGGRDVKQGFAGCSLPVVLSHNTPNNSVFLLWSNPDEYNIRGLFPRISRHKSE